MKCADGRVLNLRWGVLGLLAVVVALPLLGCGSIVANRVYYHEQYDLAAYSRLAVIPFENFTSEAKVGERVTSLFTTEILATALVDVVDPAQLTAHLRNPRVKTDELSLEELKRIRKETGASAVIFGSVDEYQMQTDSGNTFPLVTVSARLVDVETGTVLWMTTVSGSGDSKAPLVSVGRVKTLPELAQLVCGHIAETLR